MKRRRDNDETRRSQQAGSVLANLACARLLETWGWRPIFAAAGCVAMACALPVRAVVAAVPEPRQKRAAKAVETFSPRALRGVPSVCLSYCLVKLVRYALLFWLPFFLVKAGGLDAVEAAKLSALFDVGGAAGGVAAGFFADRACRGALLLSCAPFGVLSAAALAVRGRAESNHVRPGFATAFETRRRDHADAAKIIERGVRFSPSSVRRCTRGWWIAAPRRTRAAYCWWASSSRGPTASWAAPRRARSRSARRRRHLRLKAVSADSCGVGVLLTH